MTNYRSKAKESFKTRMRFFKFAHILNNVPYNENTFLNFKLEENEAFVNQITGQYYQWEKDDSLESFENIFKIKKVYQSLLNLNKRDAETEAWFDTYFEQFKPRFPEAVCNKIANSKQCAYCEITLDEINELANQQKIHKKYERGYSMEIDRKKANLEYTTENCVPACYWCNNAKTDEFTFEEFKPIGELIKKTLNARLV